MRQLVDRGCGKTVARVQALNEPRREQHGAITVHGGVAQIRRDGIPAMRRANALEVARYFVKRFVPFNSFPPIRRAAYRMSQTIFVVLDIVQGGALWTDVAATERVVFVSTDVETLTVHYPDLNPTHRSEERRVGKECKYRWSP